MTLNNIVVAISTFVKSIATYKGGDSKTVLLFDKNKETLLCLLVDLVKIVEMQSDDSCFRKRSRTQAFHAMVTMRSAWTTVASFVHFQ